MSILGLTLFEAAIRTVWWCEAGVYFSTGDDGITTTRLSSAAELMGGTRASTLWCGAGAALWRRDSMW